MNCIYCKKEFTPRSKMQKTCGGSECKRKLNNELARKAYYKAKETVPKSKKPRRSTLAEVARKARDCGMSYGEYVAKGRY